MHCDKTVCRKRGGIVWIGIGGGSSAVAIPLRNIPEGNKASYIGLE